MGTTRSRILVSATVLLILLAAAITSHAMNNTSPIASVRSQQELREWLQTRPEYAGSRIIDLPQGKALISVRDATSGVSSAVIEIFILKKETWVPLFSLPIIFHSVEIIDHEGTVSVQVDGQTRPFLSFDVRALIEIYSQPKDVSS